MFVIWSEFRNKLFIKPNSIFNEHSIEWTDIIFHTHSIHYGGSAHMWEFSPINTICNGYFAHYFAHTPKNKTKNQFSLTFSFRSPSINEMCLYGMCLSKWMALMNLSNMISWIAFHFPCTPVFRSSYLHTFTLLHFSHLPLIFFSHRLSLSLSLSLIYSALSFSLSSSLYLYSAHIFSSPLCLIRNLTCKHFSFNRAYNDYILMLKLTCCSVI